MTREEIHEAILFLEDTYDQAYKTDNFAMLIETALPYATALRALTIGEVEGAVDERAAQRALNAIILYGDLQRRYARRLLLENQDNHTKH